MSLGIEHCFEGDDISPNLELGWRPNTVRFGVVEILVTHSEILPSLSGINFLKK